MKIGFIIGAILFLVCLWFLASSDPITHDLPWHTKGDYFIIEWVAPEGAVSYKGVMASNKSKIQYAPYLCQEFKTPEPLKPGTKQQAVIRYELADQPYDLYVEVFAFDIDGNYWNVDLLHFEEDSL